MTPPIYSLQAELDRARDRVKYCARERNSYALYCNSNDEQSARRLRKLSDDLVAAERDAAYAENRLTEAESALSAILP